VQLAYYDDQWVFDGIVDRLYSAFKSEEWWSKN